MMNCHHTLHHRDKHGRLLGSWGLFRRGKIFRVFCTECGKFYGRATDRD